MVPRSPGRIPRPPAPPRPAASVPVRLLRLLLKTRSAVHMDGLRDLDSVVRTVNSGRDVHCLRVPVLHAYTNVGTTDPLRYPRKDDTKPSFLRACEARQVPMVAGNW